MTYRWRAVICCGAVAFATACSERVDARTGAAPAPGLSITAAGETLATIDGATLTRLAASPPEGGSPSVELRAVLAQEQIHRFKYVDVRIADGRTRRLGASTFDDPGMRPILLAERGAWWLTAGDIARCPAERCLGPVLGLEVAGADAPRPRRGEAPGPERGDERQPTEEGAGLTVALAGGAERLLTVAELRALATDTVDRNGRSVPALRLGRLLDQLGHSGGATLALVTAGGPLELAWPAKGAELYLYLNRRGSVHLIEMSAAPAAAEPREIRDLSAIQVASTKNSTREKP